MARKCQICGKGIQYGHLVSYSKRKTKTIRKPNLQTKRLRVQGEIKRIKICTKCLKRAKKFGKVGKIRIEPLTPSLLLKSKK